MFGMVMVAVPRGPVVRNWVRTLGGIRTPVPSRRKLRVPGSMSMD
jgi:hypothetical protein